ncbi:olfactory receptor 1019-like [Microcaecilia unicolor]|uniref:Olfactory receptor 1019-like n=1 Tax=Microcaecilia unicolor TaxID=1415580 RepID=A0A6P7X1U1_9AMPH|nr:olfactory receptor 1019-like [Microcaecilia unicolor]
MDGKNLTSVTEFILSGLTDDPKLQILLFMLLLMVYMITLLANSGIIYLVRMDPCLHTPMYFFLSTLSSLDLCSSTTVTPKMLVNFLTEKKVISFSGCATQLFFFLLFAGTQILLLAVMAYDRYVAICKPLHYPVIMNRRVCYQLVIGAYSGGFLNTIVHTSFTLTLPFCGSNHINHFFCDLVPLLKLSCADTYKNEIEISIIAVTLSSFTLSVVLISYTYIIRTIMRIDSAEGRRKTFSTCTSHFTVVTLFFLPSLLMYAHPSSSYSKSKDKLLSLFYIVVIPLLNPLIYTLRNKDVKQVLRKLLTHSSERKNSRNDIFLQSKKFNH